MLLTNIDNSDKIKMLGRIVQYSFGTVVRFNGTFREGTKIEFSLNKGQGKAIQQETTITKEYAEAKIPNELLGNNENLCGCDEEYNIYVFVTETNNGNFRTIDKCYIEVETRPEPEQIVDEKRFLIWESLENRVKSLEQTSNKINKEEILNAVKEYLGENPIEIDVPEKLSDLKDDADHRTVTDKEKEAWNGKLDASKLLEAVNMALAQAKTSGEFDGANGKDGQNGEDGRTPEKGVDYFTEADKTAFVQDVLNALPTWNGGTY